MSRVLISYEIVGKMVHCVNTNSSSRLSSSLSLFRRNIKPRSYTGFAVASEAVMATPFPPCPPHPQAALHQPLLGTTKSWITTTYWLKNLNDVKGKETIVEEECLISPWRSCIVKLHHSCILWVNDTLWFHLPIVHLSTMGKWYLMISFTHSRLLHNAIWQIFLL